MVMDGQTPTSRRRAWAAITAAALALAPAACSSFGGSTAMSFMRRVRESDDPNNRYDAYRRLASPGCYDNDQQKADAVRVLIAGLESGREPLATRALICNTLGTLRRPEGRDILLKYAEDPEPLIRTEAIRGLGKVGKPEDATLLIRAMTVDTQDTCRIAAIEALGDLKPEDPRLLASLVDGMEHELPSIRLACLRSLRQISGTDLGTDPGPWRKYVLARGEAKATARK